MQTQTRHALSDNFAPASAASDGADHGVSDAHSNCVGSEISPKGARASRVRSKTIPEATLAKDGLAIHCMDSTLGEPDPGRSQSTIEAQKPNAAAPPLDPTVPQAELGERLSDQPDPGHGRETSTHASSAEVGLLIELWRQRQDLRRAERRLDLQCQAICRRASAGDKAAAGKLWAAVKSGKADNPGLVMLLSPYTAAMASLSESASGLEKQVVRLVRQMPLWTDWAVNVRGMAELSLGGMIGEASRPVSAYRSVSAVWKRFGLAVIDGGRQRLVAGAEQALLHGYSPERRAYAYVLSTNLMRSQREGDPYRVLYDKRKAYELERGLPKAHAHNRALRVMVKELLKDAWVADRALSRTH